MPRGELRRLAGDMVGQRRGRLLRAHWRSRRAVRVGGIFAKRIVWRILKGKHAGLSWLWSRWAFSLKALLYRGSVAGDLAEGRRPCARNGQLRSGRCGADLYQGGLLPIGIELACRLFQVFQDHLEFFGRRAVRLVCRGLGRQGLSSQGNDAKPNL